MRVIDLLPDGAPHGLVWLKDGRLVATEEPGAGGRQYRQQRRRAGAHGRTPIAHGRGRAGGEPRLCRQYRQRHGVGDRPGRDAEGRRPRRGRQARRDRGGARRATIVGGRQRRRPGGRYDIATLKPLGEVAVPRYAIRVLASRTGARSRRRTSRRGR
ncbi:hypothetical protein AB5I41_07075 [Sphingomonas sp. MMS24-JH45]